MVRAIFHWIKTLSPWGSCLTNSDIFFSTKEKKKKSSFRLEYLSQQRTQGNCLYDLTPTQKCPWATSTWAGEVDQWEWICKRATLLLRPRVQILQHSGEGGRVISASLGPDLVSFLLILPAPWGQAALAVLLEHLSPFITIQEKSSTCFPRLFQNAKQGTENRENLGVWYKTSLLTLNRALTWMQPCGRGEQQGWGNAWSESLTRQKKHPNCFVGATSQKPSLALLPTVQIYRRWQQLCSLSLLLLMTVITLPQLVRTVRMSSEATVPTWGWISGLFLLIKWRIWKIPGKTCVKGYRRKDLFKET